MVLALVAETGPVRGREPVRGTGPVLVGDREMGRVLVLAPTRRAPTRAATLGLSRSRTGG